MKHIPQDVFVIISVLAIFLMFYMFLSSRMNQPSTVELLTRNDEIFQLGPAPRYDGERILNNPRSGPRVDHNITGPIYNFNIPGISEGWITLHDKMRVYKISTSPLRETEFTAPTVILLHSSQYSPYTWMETKLMFALRDSGFHAVAVDLPGHHASNHLYKLTEEEEHKEFIESIVKWEVLKRCIIVAPENSASFVLPVISEKPSYLEAVILVSPARGFNYTTLVKSGVNALILSGEFEETEIQRYSSPSIEHVIIPLSANYYFVENNRHFNKLTLEYVSKFKMPKAEPSPSEL